MPSTYSTSNRFEQQADGEHAGTWGAVQNTNHTLIEDVVSTGAATTIAVGGAVDVTLTANNGLTDQSRLAILRLTGVLTGNINVIIPNTPVNAVKSKWWFLSNETTGNFTLTFKAQGGTGIAVPQGVKTILWCDGTNIVEGLRFSSPFATDTGASGTAFVVTPGGTTPNALSSGMRIGFKSAHAATGGASTLNYAGFGTTAFKRLDGTNLQAGDFGNAQYVEAGFDGTQWVLLTPAQLIPAAGTSGNLLTSNGTAWTSAAPAGVTSIADAASGGMTFSAATGAVTATLNVNDLTSKATPTTSDGLAITDAAAASVSKKATISSVLALSTISKVFTTTGNAITSAGTPAAIPHGLGVTPKAIEGFLHCVTGELGYSAGDEFPIGLGAALTNAGSSLGVAVVYDATNLTLFYGGGGSVFAVINKGTGTVSGITNGNWTLTLRAYA